MSRSRHAGFTLIEIMVVVVIIGVLSSFAVLSLGDGGKRDRLMEEGRRLAALIQMASDQAVMEGREWGVRIESDGYLFMVLKEGAWLPHEGDRIFRSRQLEDGFSLELHVEQLEVSLTPPPDETEEESREEQAKEAMLAPQVFLMSSAERTPFEVVITAPGGQPRLRVEAPLMGEVVLHDPEQR
ncbi:MAG TPA: type II secretion system minor pseudopilin GspH [Gammaproteobacteria bacterium]